MSSAALAAATLVFVFVLASDAVFLALRAWLRDSGPASSRLFLLTRGLGPTLISVTTYVALLLAPGRPGLVYPAFAALVVGALAVVGRAHLGELRDLYRVLGRRLVSRRWWSVFGPTGRAIGAGTWALGALAALLAIGFPVVEHDALAALMEARIMVRDRSMANYLAVTEPDAVTGYLMHNFRPPFHQTLYAFFGLSAGETAAELLARATAPVFGLLTLLLVYVATREARGRTVARWALFVLAATPLFFALVYNNTVDPGRFYLSLVALHFVAVVLERPGLRQAVACGVHCGLAMFAHTLSAPILAIAGITMLARGRIRWSRRLGLATALAVAALVGGLQFHYLLQPSGLGVIGRSFARGDLLRRFLHEDPEPAREAAERPARSPRKAPPPAPEPEPTPPATHPLLAVRGQGGSTAARLVWGRLQMLTGVEYFGFTFWAFWAGAFLALRRGSRTRLEGLLLLTALVYVAVVLSGVRRLSWSNPRYIATALPFAVPFAGLALARAARALRRVRWGRGALAAAVVAPLLAVTLVRGAKIEVTNPGDFYARFRSLEWVHALRDDPVEAVRTFASRWVGLAKTLRWALADRDTQLRHGHDYFAGVLYLRDADLPGARVLLFRDVRFFYYARNTHGAIWYHRPVMTALRKSKSPAELHERLRGMGFTHVLVDTYSTALPPFDWSPMGALLADDRRVRLVFRKGEASVYELRPVPPAEPGGRGGREPAPSTASTT